MQSFFISELKVLLTIAGERELAVTVDVAVDMFFEYCIRSGLFDFSGKIVPQFSALVREAFQSKSRFATRNGQICFALRSSLLLESDSLCSRAWSGTQARIGQPDEYFCKEVFIRTPIELLRIRNSSAMHLGKKVLHAIFSVISDFKQSENQSLGAVKKYVSYYRTRTYFVRQ